MYTYVHRSTIHNNQKGKVVQLSTNNGWENHWWYIPIMEEHKKLDSIVRIILPSQKQQENHVIFRTKYSRNTKLDPKMQRRRIVPGNTVHLNEKARDGWDAHLREL